MPLTDFLHHCQILGGMLAFLWGLECLDQFLFRSALDRLGIIPRRWQGLRGILFSPLLHGNFRHLAANSMPFLVLGWFVLLDGERTFAIVTATTWLLGGLAVWLLGRSRSNHIGASGIVFGYLGYVLMRGYLIQSPMAIALAIIAGLFYGGLIWSVLPLQRKTSWEGHLSGLLAGGASAYYLQDIAAYIFIQVGV